MKSENSHAKIDYLETGSLTEGLKNYYNFENKKRYPFLLSGNVGLSYHPQLFSVN